MPMKRQPLRGKIVNDTVILKKEKVPKKENKYKELSRLISDKSRTTVIAELENHPALMKQLILSVGKEKGSAGIMELMEKHPFLKEFLTRENIITKEQILAKKGKK